MVREELEQWITKHVCSRCGGVLTIQAILEMGDQPVCKACEQIQWGAAEDVFKLAKEYVTDQGFRYHHANWWQGQHPDTTKSLEADALRSNISKMCEIIHWVQNHSDLLPGEEMVNGTTQV